MKEDSTGCEVFELDDVPVLQLDLLVLRLLLPLSVSWVLVSGAGLCCLLRKIPFSRSIPRLECRESGSSMSLITANIVKLPNVSIFNCSMLPNVQNRIKYLVE